VIAFSQEMELVVAIRVVPFRIPWKNLKKPLNVPMSSFPELIEGNDD
jgi:hypothetical protein